MRAAKAKLMQSRLEQENMNEQMTLELTQAANNLDEARLESELFRPFSPPGRRKHEGQ